MLRKARLFPEHFDPKRLRGIRSLREFDDKITAYYCGFTGVDDYYDRASAAHVVEQIAVPALVLHSANDPFIRITRGDAAEDFLPTRTSLLLKPQMAGTARLLGR